MTNHPTLGVIDGYAATLRGLKVFPTAFKEALILALASCAFFVRKPVAPPPTLLAPR